MLSHNVPSLIRKQPRVIKYVGIIRRGSESETVTTIDSDACSQNGPLHVASDYSIHQNNFSWDRLADYIWIDQPV